MREKGARWAWGVLAVGLVIPMVLPFLYMVAIASLHAENYIAALTALPFGRFFLNSAILAVCAALGQVVTSAMAAYAFARLSFPGRDRVFLAFLSVLMVPAVVLIVPRFLIIQRLGWLDSYAGLVSTELVSVWGIFLLRQFFLGIPRDLEDAARLDGASEWRIFWRIALPLSKPALAILAVFAFVAQWRNFLWPLVVTQSLDMQVVEVGLASFHRLYPANWPYQMAVAVTATLPPLVVFLVGQRYFLLSPPSRPEAQTPRDVLALGLRPLDHRMPAL
jgi:multiple sugar transport system permease protein